MLILALTSGVDLTRFFRQPPRMKSRGKFLLMGILVSLLGSCSNSYDDYPEGYVSNDIPIGYATVLIGGISYWNYHNHYYRHWPGYGYVVVRPPHNRPPYHRPPGRPEHPIARPPGTRPPGTRPPAKPENPIARPPGNRPPSGKPVSYPTTRPSTRPSNRPSSRPSSRPSVRPSMPTARPAMRSGRR